MNRSSARLRRLNSSCSSSKNTSFTGEKTWRSAEPRTNRQKKNDIWNQQRKSEDAKRDTILLELKQIQAKIEKNLLLDRNFSLSKTEYRDTQSFFDASFLMLKKLNDQQEPVYEREVKRRSRSLSPSVRFDLSQNELYIYIYDI